MVLRSASAAVLLLLAFESSSVCAEWTDGKVDIVDKDYQDRLARSLIVVYKRGAADAAISQARQRLAAGPLGARLATNAQASSGSEGSPLQIGSMRVDVFQSDAASDADGPASALADALTSADAPGSTAPGSAAAALPFYPSGADGGAAPAASASADPGAGPASASTDAGDGPASASADAGAGAAAAGGTLAEARALVGAAGGPIAYVRRDVLVSAQQQQQQPPLQLTQYLNKTAEGSLPALWGLDRIDQLKRRLNGEYNYHATAGEGCVVYVIDSGIDVSHPEFEGRASVLADITGEAAIGSDPVGHGTHVAGTVAGKTVGVAKRATVVGIRVLDSKGRGNGGGVLTAINYAAEDCKARFPSGTPRPCIINLSLGTQVVWQPLDDAVNAAVLEAGMVVVVAAGNAGSSACKASPSAAAAALTVGATTPSDARVFYSNKGRCVDLHAPGSRIYSAKAGGGYTVRDGTSMAAPHVSGAAALVWGQNPALSANEVMSSIKKGATQHTVKFARYRTSKSLLYSLAKPAV